MLGPSYPLVVIGLFIAVVALLAHVSRSGLQLIGLAIVGLISAALITFTPFVLMQLPSPFKEVILGVGLLLTAWLIVRENSRNDRYKCKRAKQRTGTMAVFTTVFAVTHDELHSCFPDVREAHRTPEIRTGKNPFTGEPMQFTRWDPGSEVSPTSLEETCGRSRVAPVESPESDYAKMLDETIPPLLATFPHVACKGIEFIELAEAILGERSHPDFYIDCPMDEGCLQVLPLSATSILADAEEESLERIAENWMSEPKSDASLKDHVSALRILQRLARIAVQSNGVLCSHAVT